MILTSNWGLTHLRLRLSNLVLELATYSGYACQRLHTNRTSLLSRKHLLTKSLVIVSWVGWPPKFWTLELVYLWSLLLCEGPLPVFSMHHAPERALAAPAKVSLISFFALAHRWSEQILARVEIVLAAHHGAWCLKYITLGAKTLSVLYHIVITGSVTQTSTYRFTILELVGRHLLAIRLVTLRDPWQGIITRLHANITSKVDSLFASHQTGLPLACISQHRRLKLLLPVVFSKQTVLLSIRLRGHWIIIIHSTISPLSTHALAIKAFVCHKVLVHGWTTIARWQLCLHMTILSW